MATPPHPLRRRLLAASTCAAVLGLLPRWARAKEAPEPLLAQTWDPRLDPSRYWVSEKLDGVRALWDGQRLRFRSGRPVAAPAWFAAALPREALDGELWLGRGQFERLSGIVRKNQPSDGEWRGIRYMVFELPEGQGDFSQRLQTLKNLVAQAGSSALQAVEHFRVADAGALQARLDTVLRAGGEGLMLHRADAPLITGRSDALLKLKPWLDDEATVVAHQPGRGRFEGMLGALVVERSDGRRFRLGTGFSESQRRLPPPVGSLVTYRYRELTARGLPRHPSFLRLAEPR